MFAICTMLSSVHTAADRHAATGRPGSAARNHSGVDREKKALCVQDLCTLRAVFRHRAHVSFQPHNHPSKFSRAAPVRGQTVPSRVLRVVSVAGLGGGIFCCSLCQGEVLTAQPGTVSFTREFHTLVPSLLPALLQ